MEKFFAFVNRKEHGSPAAIDDIEYWEDQYGISFPEILKKYWKEQNGANILRCSFVKVIKDTPLQFNVVALYGIETGNFLDIERHVRWARKSKEIPSSWFPFALDEDEDEYFWDSKTDKIWYVCMGNIEHPFVVADSMNEFFYLLNTAIHTEIHEETPELTDEVLLSIAKKRRIITLVSSIIAGIVAVMAVGLIISKLLK